MSTVEERRIAELEAENARLRSALEFPQSESHTAGTRAGNFSSAAAQIDSDFLTLWNAHADLLMWRVDGDGRFVQLTGKGFETIKCPPEAMLGKRLTRFLPKGNVRDAMLQMLEQGQPAAGVFSMGKFQLDCRAIPLRQKRTDGRIPDVIGSMWTAKIVITPTGDQGEVPERSATRAPVPVETHQPFPVDDLLRLLRQLPMGVVTADAEGENLLTWQLDHSSGGELWRSVFDVFDSPGRAELRDALLEACQSGKPQTVWTMRAWEQTEGSTGEADTSQRTAAPPRHFVCYIAPASVGTGDSEHSPSFVTASVPASKKTDDAKNVVVSAEHARGIIAVWLELTSELQNYTRDLQRRAEIERDMLDASLLQVIAMLSHRINNPLAAVVNYASGCMRRLQNDLDDGNDSRLSRETGSAVIKQLREIVSEAEMASNGIRQLRSVLKPASAGHAEYAPTDLVREAIAIVAARAAAAHVEIHVTATSDLPKVFVDPLRLQLVLVNLLMNAIEAIAEARAAGNSRWAKMASLSTEAVSVDDRATVSVRLARTDNGAVSISVRNLEGKLPAGQRELLFEPFFSTRPASRGLGLAISRSIAESYGGSLEINESAQNGVTVSLTIPFRGGKTTHDYST